MHGSGRNAPGFERVTKLTIGENVVGHRVIEGSDGVGDCGV